MKSIFSLVATLALLLASASLTGCKTGWFAKQQQPQSQAQAQPSAASQATTATSIDTAEMCALHRRMLAASTPAERDAMLNERMRNMSPEVRQEHIDRMRQSCQ